MARPISNKYSKNYIIKKMRKYVDSEQNFSHIKELCIKNDWNYAYLIRECIPKYIEQEKSLQHEERIITHLYDKLKDKQEIFLLSICSTSVNGAIFQLKSNYGYKNEDKSSADDVIINLIIERNKAIKEAIENEDL